MNEMSGDACKASCSDSSRIPVASPRYSSGGVRRSSSMRLRGERPSALRLHGGSAAALAAAAPDLCCPPPDLVDPGAHRPRDNTASSQHARHRTRSLVSPQYIIYIYTLCSSTCIDEMSFLLVRMRNGACLFVLFLSIFL